MTRIFIFTECLRTIKASVTAAWGYISKHSQRQVYVTTSHTVVMSPWPVLAEPWACGVFDVVVRETSDSFVERLLCRWEVGLFYLHLGFYDASNSNLECIKISFVISDNVNLWQVKCPQNTFAMLLWYPVNQFPTDQK